MYILLIVFFNQLLFGDMLLNAEIYIDHEYCKSPPPFPETYPRVSQQAFNRWGVAYTLINNPNLIQYTASNLALKKKLVEERKHLPGQLNSTPTHQHGDLWGKAVLNLQRSQDLDAAEVVTEKNLDANVDAPLTVGDPWETGRPDVAIMATPADTVLDTAVVVETSARNSDTNTEAPDGFAHSKAVMETPMDTKHWQTLETHGDTPETSARISDTNFVSLDSVEDLREIRTDTAIMRTPADTNALTPEALVDPQVMEAPCKQ